ncbi:PP2C family protein-serine/threonine phosphatase [Streptomyces alfalfae]
MRTYATAQLVGGRPRQCDATAVTAAPTGARAYALLDGVGTGRDVAHWTRGAALRTATFAARVQDAEVGLRAAYDHYTGRPYPEDPFRDLPYAAAVVAVTAPGRPLTVAWSGDARAYLWTGAHVHQLTADHNERRVYPPFGAPNVLTSCLGADETDEEVQAEHGHPAVEGVTRHLGQWARLLLVSDGAYEPLEQSCMDMADFLTGPLEYVPGAIVQGAVQRAGLIPDNATALVADLWY